MDKSTAAADAIRQINLAKEDVSARPSMIKAVCAYFDMMKGEILSDADKLFLHYLANQAGLPQYYYPMLNVGEDVVENIGLQTLANFIHESSLVVGEGVMLHRYQKEILAKFEKGKRNRFFLSAATSFGKTFLIYEIMRKMEYENIALIFPTISLLSENLFKIHTRPEYAWIKNRYLIHTLSETENLEGNNLYIFTPERFLSFLDKNHEVKLDFVFVDEVYKLDNGFIIDEVQQENERDVAYRIALHELLRDDDTDALLVGPYIVLPSDEHDGHNTSFKSFLDWYGFTAIDYNLYDIVNKDEVSVGTAKRIKVNDTFYLSFTKSTKTAHVVQLVKQLLERDENAIIYCSQKPYTETWAKELINGIEELPDVKHERVLRLTNHLSNLFAEGKGAQWIVTKALKKGIGIHHGLVPKYIQQEIISLFNDGILKVLVCTTTITEGVNTTAKNMIVLSGKKGTKDLKKFDAQNIEGRAGRFMEHYSGRVFILDKEFSKRMNEDDEMLQHKLFDKNSEKKDVDLVLTEPNYLSQAQRERKEILDNLRMSGSMPEACFDEFRTVAYEDKIYLYNTIARFSDSDRDKIKELIRRFVGQHKTYYAGLELICQSVRSIIKNNNLRYYVENGDPQRGNCYLVDMVSAFVARGFAGSANYYIIKKNLGVDAGVRKAAEFVFNTLRYQVVKYFGLFNLIYKNYESVRTGKTVDEISGIEALLLRLEYCADTQLGRKASDIGASFKVVNYYDTKERFHNQEDVIAKLYSELDDFEKFNVARIDQIL